MYCICNPLISHNEKLSPPPPHFHNIHHFFNSTENNLHVLLLCKYINKHIHNSQRNQEPLLNIPHSILREYEPPLLASPQHDPQLAAPPPEQRQQQWPISLSHRCAAATVEYYGTIVELLKHKHKHTHIAAKRHPAEGGWRGVLSRATRTSAGTRGT